MPKITVDIVSLEKRLYKGPVKSITVPTTTGEITILPNHIPLITNLEAGELRIKVDEGQGIYSPDTVFVAVSGGFLEVKPGSRVDVIADSAVRVDEIDEGKAQEARERAEQIMAAHRRGETQLGNEEYARVAADLARAAAQIKVARRKRRA